MLDTSNFISKPKPSIVEKESAVKLVGLKIDQKMTWREYVQGVGQEAVNCRELFSSLGNSKSCDRKNLVTA